jgi:6-phosphofructokinase
MIKGNALIGQSGGPTSVINSSLAGVIEAAKTTSFIKDIYGMQYGIEGFMQEWIYDLGKQSPHILSGLKQTPSSALGSTRYKVKEEDLSKILVLLKKYNIRYFFLIGGNDTMDTINKVEKYCHAHNYEMTGIGIPKTVDNDLYGTDHTPGFASAARSNILNVMQGGILARDMQKVDKFVVYQTIGRDAGWLAAATAMARNHDDDAPHLIYTPENYFDRDKFLWDVESCIKAIGWVSIVCGEGIKYSDGLALHRMITDKFGYRGEFQITESLIMSDFVRASEIDLAEAYLCGVAAVNLAANDESGNMVSIERISDDPYTIRPGKVPLKDVANNTKPMPVKYFNEESNYISQAFIDYMKPLTGALPEFTRLEKIMLKRKS